MGPNARTGPFGALQQGRIEDRPADGQPVIAKGAVSRRCAERSLKRRAVGGVDAHPGELCRRPGFQRLEDAHLVQEPRRLRTQVLGADLVTWERRAIGQHDVASRAREEKRGAGAGGPAPDDQDLCIVPGHQLIR